MKPGPGYHGKYRGTVWQLVFLDQLGADGADPRVQRAWEYVLTTARRRAAASAHPGASTSSGRPRRA